LDNFERFSKIVGRRNLAMAGFLAYFTPLWVRFDGMLQRGWGNILFCGDTTTAKTETIRRLIMLLKAGMLITAETATAVGLTGTATQVEKEGWFVDWGFLVLLGS
jgi:DNA replicative helicase MCM subunit Mcm2 (Cdc46/Mcm family)